MSLNHQDLKGTISPEVTVDQYKPKSGDIKDVIVVAMFLTDQDPAADLNTFVQRSFVDVITSEVSPSTDDNGNYVVFVEMTRSQQFPQSFSELLKDVQRVAGPLDWEIITYLGGDRVFDVTGEWAEYVSLTPDSYVSREDFVEPAGTEVIKEFFSASRCTGMQWAGNKLTITDDCTTIVTEVVDVGDYDTIINKYALNHVGFGVGRLPYEGRLLESIVGRCQILPLGDYLMISKGDSIALLANTHIQ